MWVKKGCLKHPKALFNSPNRWFAGLYFLTPNPQLHRPIQIRASTDGRGQQGVFCRKNVSTFAHPKCLGRWPNHLTDKLFGSKTLTTVKGPISFQKRKLSTSLQQVPSGFLVIFLPGCWRVQLIKLKPVSSAGVVEACLLGHRPPKKK